MNEVPLVMMANTHADKESHFAALGCFSKCASIAAEVATNSTSVNVSFGSHDQ